MMSFAPTRTSECVSTPLALTASITESTALSLFLWFAFRVGDSLQGVFLFVGGTQIGVSREKRKRLVDSQRTMGQQKEISVGWGRSGN